MISSPWAILLCKFKDQTAVEPYPRQRFDDLFTAAGRGKWGMVDFFDAMSHGTLDLSGSRVFPPAGGWYTLEQNQADYLGPATPDGGRSALYAWAKKAATNAGDSLTGFDRVVVITNVGGDLFGSEPGAVSNDGRDGQGMSSLSPSLMGQEMGHAYGLAHSRFLGLGESTDRWDTMSTRAAFMGPHPLFTEADPLGRPVFRIGPGLNAVNMWLEDWLDLTRVWTAGGNTRTQVTLRPLHRRDLPGYLCVQVADLFVEFRMNEAWDVGLPNPVVLIHSFGDGFSNLHGALTVGATLGVGDTSDAPLPLHGDGARVTVTAIDPAARTATLDVQCWSAWRPVSGPSLGIWGDTTGDGGGLVFINGKIRKVPPSSPLLPLLAYAIEAQDASTIRHGAARVPAQRQAYGRIAEVSMTRLHTLGGVQQPAESWNLEPTSGATAIQPLSSSNAPS